MPPPRKTAAGSTPVEAITHADNRINLPTADAEEFVDARGRSAPVPVLYPRDPTLDPQLVWKGKDEQDGKRTCWLTLRRSTSRRRSTRASSLRTCARPPRSPRTSPS